MWITRKSIHFSYDIMNKSISILFLIFQDVLVSTMSVNMKLTSNSEFENVNQENMNPGKSQHTSSPSGFLDENKQIISVRITSSVAVNRGKGTMRPLQTETQSETVPDYFFSEQTKYRESLKTTPFVERSTESTAIFKEVDNDKEVSEIPLHLIGANFEFIKQLNEKKRIKISSNVEKIHPFQTGLFYSNINSTYDSIAEPSENIEHGIESYDVGESNVPLARSVQYTSSSNKVNVNNNITNSNFAYSDTPRVGIFSTVIPNTVQPQNAQKIFTNLPKIYSEPAKVYSEPAKFYSEPAKIYSEPSKFYSEPAKVYSEPAKFYSQPASLFLQSDQKSWSHQYSSFSTFPSSTFITTPPTTLSSRTSHLKENLPENNYEIDEKVSVQTNGKTHGVQETTSDNCKTENCKVGYVVEGRQYRKYRVEERTADGFIVGEYGVVRNVDGALRGVRYTADSEASPRLIHEALVKFLQLR